MENIRKIMEIMDDDEMFPTRNEWAYIKISNELKKLHLKLQELSRRKELYSPATIDPSAPSLIWRDLRRVRIRPLR
jgi:hypothetical protein